jgi:hypothetical protein
MNRIASPMSTSPVSQTSTSLVPWDASQLDIIESLIRVMRRDLPVPLAAMPGRAARPVILEPWQPECFRV